MDGNIIDIKKFTVHDGPGIRSTVFLKGCPLRCVWCHNPEGIENKISLWYFEKKCIGCHKCVASCKSKALSVNRPGSADSPGPHILIDRSKCANAGHCVDACPAEALCFDGRRVSSRYVIDVLLEDKPFYERSGGGITVSGGDPLFQHEFSLEILKCCKEQGIHTAIETSMFAQRDIINGFLKHADLFIVDLKLFDPMEHERYTGVNNELIKSNFRFIASKKEEILVRTPLIPGITAIRQNIRQIARFVRETREGIPMELMNFNPLAENKYLLMGKNYEMIKGMRPLSDRELDELYRVIEDEGVKTVREEKVKY